MEKLMYLIWTPSEQSESQTKDLLLKTLMPAMQQLGAHRLRLTLDDADVSPAQQRRIQTTHPSPDAVISFWLNHAGDRTTLEQLLQLSSARCCGYLVTECEPLPNSKHPHKSGMRSYGMNQVVLLRQPKRLSREEWIDLWIKKHTTIAMRTQATFGYRQNIVTRALTADALTIDAIVEENFPPDAMQSNHAFYNAKDDDNLLRKNQQELFGSVQKFIDLDEIDCLPMSEYNF